MPAGYFTLYGQHRLGQDGGEQGWGQVISPSVSREAQYENWPLYAGGWARRCGYHPVTSNLYL